MNATLTVPHSPGAAEATAAVQPPPAVEADKSGHVHRRTGGWPLVLEWVLLSSIPLLVTLGLKGPLMRWWSDLTMLWSVRLGLPMRHVAIGASDGDIWATPSDGTVMPSSQTLAWTWLGLISLWAITHFFTDRFHPLKVTTRALCLVQATACVFFMFSPARFPYTVTQHMHALLDMGYGLMLASGPMLALGWGLLMPSFMPKIVAPLGVLAYFAVMLPHKVLLHAWLLTHGSALFMPVLFLSFGMLFDLWIFIALYAWLASLIPKPIPVLRSAS